MILRFWSSNIRILWSLGRYHTWWHGDILAVLGMIWVTVILAQHGFGRWPTDEGVKCWIWSSPDQSQTKFLNYKTDHGIVNKSLWMNMNHMCGIFLFSNSRCSVEPRAWTVSFRKDRKFQQSQEPKKVGRSSGPACSHRSDVITAILSQLELLSVTEATSALLQLQDTTSV